MPKHNKYRSVVRFICVGVFGTLLQYGIYYLLLELFRRTMPDSKMMTSVAFTCGFLVEMVVNYFLTNYFTFRTRPSWRNAGGFVVGKVINFVVQLVLLNLLLMVISEEISGILAIMLAGIVNYFVLLPFFSANKKS